MPSAKQSLSIEDSSEATVIAPVNPKRTRLTRFQDYFTRHPNVRRGLIALGIIVAIVGIGVATSGIGLGIALGVTVGAKLTATVVAIHTLIASIGGANGFMGIIYAATFVGTTSAILTSVFRILSRSEPPKLKTATAVETQRSLADEVNDLGLAPQGVSPLYTVEPTPAASQEAPKASGSDSDGEPTVINPETEVPQNNSDTDFSRMETTNNTKFIQHKTRRQSSREAFIEENRMETDSDPLSEQLVATLGVTENGKQHKDLINTQDETANITDFSHLPPAPPVNLATLKPSIEKSDVTSLPWDTIFPPKPIGPIYNIQEVTANKPN